jgi:aminobenzoyl-glutamate utilization protein B
LVRPDGQSPFREVWELAELSLVEGKSFRVHLRELEAAGFRTVSVGTSRFPTAFVSEWTQGAGGPVIAYLPEYDALPGLGNAPEPQQTPAASGNTNGQGCGHEMIGAACTGLHRTQDDDGSFGHARHDPCLWLRRRGGRGREGLFRPRRAV